jgi:hypothetical protein
LMKNYMQKSKQFMVVKNRLFTEISFQHYDLLW